MITPRLLFLTRGAMILALIAFTGVMVIFDHNVWAVTGFVMAIIASLSPVNIPDEVKNPK